MEKENKDTQVREVEKEKNKERDTKNHAASSHKKQMDNEKMLNVENEKDEVDSQKAEIESKLNEELEKIENIQSPTTKSNKDESGSTDEVKGNWEEETKKYKDLYLRKSADFENFKKQKEKQFIEFIKYADESIVKIILPILDDLSRAIKSADESEGLNKKFVEGFKLVEQKFINSLKERGVKQIDCAGKKLDVSLHEALAQVDKDNVETDTIVEVFEQGYLLHDKVIRHAKVVVSK